ncbi:hypothetical protein [Rhodococcus opacus]|uniref:hypothetical protein n=1 Tax=Rhodococcus opacus TaxID=37919 RepID=UPI0002E2DD5B|nr:hypothetical protein [Rhodococcus opacus]
MKIWRRPPRTRTGDGGDFEHSHDIENVGIEWPSTTEDTDGRETVLSSVRLSCPAGADILASDRVELPDGDFYRVDGKPARVRNPFSGWEPGVTVNVKAVI